MTPALFAFIESHASGVPLVDAYMSAFPGAARMPRHEAMVLAREVIDGEQAQEYLAFLREEGRSAGAIPMRDHIFDLRALEAEGERLMSTLVSRGGASDSSAVAAFAQRVKLVELQGRASGHYAQRTELGVVPGGGSGKFSVEWTE